MLPQLPRTVKPRQPSGEQWLPIIVAHRDSQTAYCERTGCLYAWDDLEGLFRSHPGALVIAPGAAHLVAELDGYYGDDPSWQYRVSPVKREVGPPERRRRHVTDTLVNYFGWSGRDRRKQRGHWHYPLDPILFANIPPLALLPGLEATDLLAWGQDVRDWCHVNELRLSPTVGGIGGQLLRDPRWYPAARRKVPKATNARARPALPGNYYKLLWPEHTPVDATCIDMSSSHHQLAASLTLPSSDHLFARGNFHATETPKTPVPRGLLWAPKGSVRYNETLQAHGLLRVQLNVRALTSSSQFPPPYLEQSGRIGNVYIYTNEIPLIRELGTEIEGIDAAWVSHVPETGLNGYAQWALAEIAEMSEQRKRWCKTALLATYGNLAARSRVTEWAYRRATTGTPKEYPAGPTTLKVISKVSDTELEMPTVNVIHRGMIEAEQRRVTLNMARHLHDIGHTVICIYADAIMVRSDRQLPLLPSPWRIDAHLTRVRFYAPTAFTSVERSRLPGIPLDALSRREAARLIRART